jgi:exopolyphosphatase/guanosine-5'-triphosphate,3'-diphosphate pyrophosphatase
MRLAVLDLGLDAVHLVVVEASGHGPATRIFARRSWTETVRLAISAPDQRLAPAAFARALAAVDRLLGYLAAFDPACELVAIASAALSGSANGTELCEEVEGRRGIAIDRLTGEEEARLSYLGARSCVSASDRLAVADLGGASLELATGAGGCDLVFSVPLGVRDLRDVYLRPERGLDRAARERVSASVRFGAADAARAIWDRRPERLAFTSGTAHALGALAARLRIHSASTSSAKNTPSVGPSGRPPLADELELRPLGTDELELSVLARLADVLSQFRPIELPALGVDEARSDTIAVGAVVLHTLMELLGMGSAVISPRGRREGAALLHLRGGQIPEVARVHLAVT